MKAFPREALSYGILLVILLGIASLAALQTIDFLEGLIPDEPHRQTVSLLIWTFTLGFMLIAGAFGLWAIRFSAHAEARRRVGHFVDSMDYLRDGLVTVDRRGRITGANPAARIFAAGRIAKGTTLQQAFPDLTETEVTVLLTSEEPQEIERRVQHGPAWRTVRFRSQSSEGLTLILLSDITAMNAQRLHNRQRARLQLIGQISRGMAHDFNNILCAISGHAALLRRLPPGSVEAADSINAILQSVQKGSALAGHLMALSKTHADADYTVSVLQAAQLAAEDLRSSLPDAWQVETDLQEMPAVALPSNQIEQLILNLGLLAADALTAPGVVRVATVPFDGTAVAEAGGEYAGAVVVTAYSLTSTNITPEPLREREVEPGAILAVVRSLVEGVGGLLQTLEGTNRLPIYRLVLPRGLRATHQQKKEHEVGELAHYVANWSAILAAPAGKHVSLEESLRRIAVRVKRVPDIPSLLAGIEAPQPPDAVIVDDQLLIREPKAVLRAILKLCPKVALVTFVSGTELRAADLSEHVAFVPSDADTAAVVLAMVQARGLALNRRNI